MKKCTLYCEKTDFAKNAVSVTIFAVFYPKNVNFKKSFCLPHRPPNTNLQTKNRDDSLKNAACSAKTQVFTDQQTCS